MFSDALFRFLTLADPNSRYVAFGAVMLGVAGGLLGCFAYLRRQSLVGDAVAHAALPGVCLGFLATGSKSPLALALGALATGWIAMLAMAAILRWSRIKSDAAIGIVLSVFFGAGAVLLTKIQQSGLGGQAGLDKFLFGQAASLVGQDVWTMSALAGLLIAAAALCYKEIKVFCFDAGFAASIGLRTGLLDVFLTTLVVMAVVVGLQAVGVVLMSAMLVIPAAAARQWTDRLSRMLLIAAAFGAVSGYAGALFSALAPKLPTGPLMVLTASALFVVSLAFAPERGMLARVVRVSRMRGGIARENVLKDLYGIIDSGEAGTAERISAGRRSDPRRTLATLRALAKRGLAAEGPGGWRLTEDGNRAARKVIRGHRLWETYLAGELRIDPSKVHRDAEDVEHILDPELLERLDSQLGKPKLDPHGKPIPE